MVAVSTKVRKPTEITSPVVYRCTDRKTGEIYYAVPSDTTDAIYKVTFNEVTRRYEDTCPACVECKHVRAVRSVVLAKAEMKKQEITYPANAPVETHRVSCVHGVAGPVWYPEYNSHGTWYRFPDEGTTHCVRFYDVSPERAQAWLVDRLAEVEGSKAESKMFAWKRAMDEQYSSDPRTELAKQREEEETRRANVRMFYDGL